ncbi:hypothetical protein PCAR4_850020 [Paraburkholderia caribensis]|nr:hypothetical protein PCAR4_850020 [Paraburkholderia caribensis]
MRQGERVDETVLFALQAAGVANGWVKRDSLVLSNASFRPSTAIRIPGHAMTALGAHRSLTSATG